MTKSSIVNSKPALPAGRSSIYILHGWSYSLYKWEPLISILKRKKLNLVLLKIPGLTDKINKPWTIEDYLDWLNEKIGNGIDKIILIGHSNGGRIAMNFAVKYPDKVSRLILIDSSSIYHDELYIKLKRKFFGVIAKTGRKILKNNLGKNLLYFLAGENDYKDADENMKSTMINLLSSDRNLNVEDISVPTIILWGAKDKITPLSDGKLLNEKIVNSKLYVVNNARHSPQFTHPKEVAEIISKNI